MVISVTFCVMVIVFVVYDVLVQRRNAKLIQNAAQSNAIVSSMFPSQIRDRLIGSSAGQTGAKSLKSYMKAPNAAKLESSAVDDSKPLADLFLATTVLFADIVGFTAWSSTREPPHVFRLLETIYSAFDKIAERRRVFKVETVGDCCKCTQIHNESSMFDDTAHIFSSCFNCCRCCRCCKSVPWH